jgi:hypothetical protein
LGEKEGKCGIVEWEKVELENGMVGGKEWKKVSPGN